MKNPNLFLLVHARLTACCLLAVIRSAASALPPSDLGLSSLDQDLLGAPLRYNISEEQPSGSPVTDDILDIIARREGYTENVRRTLSMAFVDNRQDLFQLDEKMCRLTVAKQLDREIICQSVIGMTGGPCMVDIGLAVQPSAYFQV